MDRQNSKYNRKEAIINVAADIFREKGYVASTMRDLAEKVGMEAASLYNHIQSKEALLQEICFQIADKFLTHLGTIEAQDSNGVGDIEQIIRYHIGLMIDMPSFVSVANHEWKHLSEPHLSRFLNLRNEYEQRLMKLLKQGMTNGSMKKMEVSVALNTILSALRWIEYRYKLDKYPDRVLMEQDVVTILLKGLCN